MAVVTVFREEAQTSLPVSPRSLNASDEAAHLRQLLDRQPACMMRVGCDGVLLAVNDAALSLLGADALAQVIDTPLTDRLVPEHHEIWRDFAARVWSDGSGSIECDMVDRAGVVRATRLQATALPDHPDGIRSLLVSARDLSSTRRLEQALQETETTSRVVEEVRAALVDAQSARDASLAAAAESQMATEALRVELERSLAEQRRMADGIIQRDHDRRQIEGIIRQREEESQFLQSAVERYESEHQRLETDVDRAIGESRNLQAQLDETRRDFERAQADIIHARAEREAAHAELEQALADREQFEATVKIRDVSRQRMLAEHATARMQAERALADAAARHERLAKQIETLARECALPDRDES